MRLRLTCLLLIPVAGYAALAYLAYKGQQLIAHITESEFPLDDYLDH